MKIITSVKQMQETSLALHRKGKLIGLVPTMGALHEGHLSLVRMARKKSDVVVVSIFVNSTQFGLNEDFQNYPRVFAQDKTFLQKEKCDIIFYPSVKEMYPENYLTFVNVEDITTRLEGASRSGHFRGVATIVAKLFNIVQPDLAFFGQKDAQQAVVIKRMVADLNFPAKIVVAPTVRDQKGLAFSSRNSYLSPDEKSQALCLYEALEKARDLIQLGQTNPQMVISSMQTVIQKSPLAEIDYVAITDTKRLLPVDKIRGDVLISLAVRVGNTRLIDNICVRANKKVQESRC
jgi:pantoate--beta-alanine ligase